MSALSLLGPDPTARRICESIVISADQLCHQPQADVSIHKHNMKALVISLTTPHGCARGKVIGSVVVVDTKITKSGDLVI